MKPGSVAALLFVAIVGGVIAWRLWPQASSPPAVESPPPPVAAAPPSASAASSVAAAPSVPAPPPVAPSEAIAAGDVQAAIEQLVGPAAAGAFRFDDFARRLTATVDNLAREKASPSLWPVAPTPGRFLARTSGDATVIDADNGQRYAPFVQIVERLDLRQVVTVYRRMLPLLQESYESLGYPGKSFHERLIAVIDHLLAAPEPTGPVRVHLPSFKGTPPARPWLLYEFDDPALQALSAGQKLMVRVGPVEERRLKTRLRELRARLLEQHADGA
jgi:hypothetical protein